MAVKYTWEQRIERAEQLAQSMPHVQDVMAFYAEVLKWQYDLFHLITIASVNQGLSGNFEQDHSIFLERFDSLLEVVSQQGSIAMTAQVEKLSTARNEWKELLTAYWNGEFNPEYSFFARTFIQPYLERLAGMHTLPADSRLIEPSATDIEEFDISRPQHLCPFCKRKPQLTILSNEPDIPGLSEGSAESGHRFLMCGDCQTLWPFQRIVCVNCRDENPHNLSYYCADAIPYIRVECCDTCRHYIKSIDLTSNNRCVPTVDELAAIPLDLWAREQGYRKIQPNLAGM